MATDKHVQALLDAIAAGDRRAAEAVVDVWASTHGYMSAVTALIEPALQAVGDQWSTPGQAYVLAHGYLGAKLAESALAKALADRSDSALIPAGSTGTVVLGNIEDDYHSLGRRMVRIFAEADGWAVHDLGNDVPAETFVEKAVETGARVIGVSAMMFSTAQNIRKVRAELDHRGLRGAVQLAVGGAVFVARPALAADVGGDGTCPNALSAPALFHDLASRIPTSGAPR